MSKVLKIIFKIIGGILSVILLYFISAVCLSIIPVNSDFVECKTDSIEIYILSNGIHTDIVLPLNNEMKDWTTFVEPNETKRGDSNSSLVAFGWGDKGFYLETPQWSDLKVKTVFNALFSLGSSAMHVTFYKGLRESDHCKKIHISKESYLEIVKYIESNFVSINGKPQLIKGAYYSDNDLFYDANGAYSLFNTCNTWANGTLKIGRLKACVWTPFDKGIFYHYRK